MKIAVYPFAASGSVADNFAAIRRGIEAARRSGVRLLVFQECALSGYPPVEVDEIEKIDFRANDACIRDVKAIAKESDMFIALGSVRESSGSYYNSIVLFGPDVEILGTYDKRALWGWDRENFTLGESDGIFRIDDFLVGFRICYEVRFPEYFREMFAADVPLCFVSFCDVADAPDPGRYEILNAHLITRATENVMTLVSVNSLSKTQTAPTAIYSPDGKVLLRATDHVEALLVYDFEVRERSRSGEGRALVARALMQE